MKILVIATQLPPFIGSGNVRALNYINYLSRLGHKIDVIGVDYPKDSVAYDIYLENSFDDNVKVNRIKPGYFYRFFYRKKEQVPNSDNNRQVSTNGTFKGKLNSFIKNSLVIPDAFMFWIAPAYTFAKTLLKQNKYDIVLTMHETPSSHIVGYLLKKKFKYIRWVGYWSDPWNGDSLREERFALKKFVEESMEKLIVNKVDKLLFTTLKTKEFYQNKYKLDNEILDIIYRGYDKKKYELTNKASQINLKGIDSSKVNLIHLGTIYNKLRDITPLYDALNKLKKEKNDIYCNINIIFIGQFDDSTDQKKLEEHDAVTILPFVPYEEALEYTVKADILLLYGNKNSTQVPGKVYEYLGSPAVILSLYGDKSDELIELMKLSNKGPVIENDSTTIYKELITLINDYQDNNLNEDWKKPVTKFEWEKVVKDLENKLIN